MIRRLADDVLGSISVVMQYEANLSDRHNDELTEWTSGDTHMYWSIGVDDRGRRGGYTND